MANGLVLIFIMSAVGYGEQVCTDDGQCSAQDVSSLVQLRAGVGGKAELADSEMGLPNDAKCTADDQCESGACAHMGTTASGDVDVNYCCPCADCWEHATTVFSWEWCTQLPLGHTCKHDSQCISDNCRASGKADPPYVCGPRAPFVAGLQCENGQPSQDVINRMSAACSRSPNADGEITSKFCAASKNWDMQSYADYVQGPCSAYSDRFHLQGCSETPFNDWHCFPGDYCVSSSPLSDTPHNRCCGLVMDVATKQERIQCYAGVELGPGGSQAHPQTECPNYGDLDVCPCAPCGQGILPYGVSVASNTGLITNGALNLRQLGVSSDMMCSREGDICGVVYPCDKNNIAVAFRNWFCNTGTASVYISVEKLDEESNVVYEVEAPPSWVNKSDVRKRQALAINQKTALYCQPCATFEGEYFENYGTFHLNNSDINGAKWCSVGVKDVPGTSGDWYEMPIPGCHPASELPANRKDTCAGDADCCEACPRDDAQVGKLGWLCAKGTNHPCINRYGFALNDRLAVKVLSDNATVLYPPLGSLVGHKSCDNMGWCQALKIGFGVAMTIIPLGMEIAAALSVAEEAAVVAEEEGSEALLARALRDGFDPKRENEAAYNWLEGVQMNEPTKAQLQELIEGNTYFKMSVFARTYEDNYNGWQHCLKLAAQVFDRTCVIKAPTIKSFLPNTIGTDMAILKWLKAVEACV